MLTTAKRAVVMTAIATAGLFVSGGAVQASTASTTAASFAVVAVPTAPAALPNTTVSGTPAKFNPTSNTVAPKNYGSRCTSALAVFTITNAESTAVTFKASINGGTFKLFGTLAKHTKGYVCEEGPAGTYFRYSIKGSTSKFKSTLS
jgi:hypothetical protein